ncbi:hypothetical protein HJB89_25265 [Rhizobium sp. NZLR8]|uniref:hypothetical protein n=1 Tax=Rhizobium sp. NZLR8 TaxID=2731104 RepID=UPI001C830F60|nr:hypothetical protein [Rhizobium sp. NZLR8]MBX5160397.1 hypothetical protein [Rhizobium sp. NZLR8]
MRKNLTPFSDQNYFLIASTIFLFGSSADLFNSPPIPTVMLSNQQEVGSFNMRFIMAIVQAILQFMAAGLNTATAFLDWLTSRLSGGGAAPAAPVANLEMALPEPERLGRAEELAAGEAKAVEVINNRLTPAQQVQVFASMPVEDRILADLSALTKDQIDWLNVLTDDQLQVVKEATERRVAAALDGKPHSLMAILSVGQSAPKDDTVFAHRLAAKRASQPALTHPQSSYSLQ